MLGRFLEDVFGSISVFSSLAIRVRESTFAPQLSRCVWTLSPPRLGYEACQRAHGRCLRTPRIVCKADARLLAVGNFTLDQKPPPVSAHGLAPIVGCACPIKAAMSKWFLWMRSATGITKASSGANNARALSQAIRPRFATRHGQPSDHSFLLPAT